MKIKKIKDEMYKRDIYLVENFDRTKFFKKFKDITFEEVLEEHFVASVLQGKKKNGGGVWFLILGTNETGKERQCTLVHEIFHLTLRIADYSGFEISVEADEPLAYYHEHLYRQII